MKTKSLIFGILTLFLHCDLRVAAEPLGTEFTYQGRLSDGGKPAIGNFDLRFTMHDAATAGSQVGGTVTWANVAVAEGVFTVTLDFGAGVFDGNARWLEISVRPAEGGSFTKLVPRQPLNPAPIALYALTPAGPAGAQGDPGPAGSVGPQGPAGVKGDKGEKGDAGATGPQGSAGAAGAMGPTGAQGPQGPTGLKGDKGEAGAAGLTGPAGTPGAQGTAGPKGDKGDTGVAGATGPQGPAGVAGPQGAIGPTGAVGPQGPIGATGTAGPQGTQGPAGAAGASGPQGPRGLNWRGAWSGLIAYAQDDAVAFNGASWMAKVANTGAVPLGGSAFWEVLADRGAIGVTGASGATGPQGPAGALGATGPQGAQGIQGPPGSADAWSRTGNAGTTAANFLGTTDNQPLQLRVNNQPAIHVQSDKRVGFGTTTLDANAFAQFNLPASDSVPHLRIKSSLGNAGFGLQFVNPDETWFVGPNIGNWPDDRFNILADSSNKGIIIAANGNVGLGSVSAASPFATLTVDGTIGFPTVASPMLYIYPSGTANAQKPVIVHSPSFPEYGLYYQDAGDRFEFKSSAADLTPSLVVDLDSNWVAIASPIPKPGYELSVNGQIVCEDLLIQDSSLWPDYVFAPDYPLKPLAEVEAHIREKQHLPGIPSAAEIEKDGITVGSTQKRMMEKIEELTLYAIDQDKRLTAQDRQIAELKEMVLALTARKGGVQ